MRGNVVDEIIQHGRRVDQADRGSAQFWKCGEVGPFLVRYEGETRAWFSHEVGPRGRTLTVWGQ
jgi:hypothetical protein